MKKMYLFSIVVFFIANVKAQSLTKVWSKLCNGSDFSWFNTSTDNNNVTGIAYNPATNKVLVGNRNNNIYILNASTGAQEGTVTLGGDLGTEAFKFNKIRVTSDGVIYGISLATGATSNARIYRWASQTSAPTLCATFTTTERCGDAFGLSGSGTSTVLYAAGAALASGTSNTKIYVFTTNDGTQFFNTSTIDVPSGTGTAGQWVNRSVDPIGANPTAGVWIDMSGGPARRLNVTGSAPTLTSTVGFTTTTGYNNGQVADSYCGMRYLAPTGGKKYLAFAGANNAGDGITMKVLDVTSETEVRTLGTDTLWSAPNTPITYNTNGNGTGDVAFKDNGDGSYDIFYVATNNGIACVRTTTSFTSLPVFLSSFAGSIKDGIASLTWKTDNEINNKGFEIEKSFNGSDFSTIGFVAAGENASNTYSFSESKNLAANNYYRLKQVDKDGQYTRSSVILLQNKTNIQQLVLFGNVVKSQLNAQIEATKTGASSIAIVDMSGKVVKTIQKQLQKGTNQVSFNVSGLQAGNYQLQIATTEGRTSARFVVAK